MPEVLIIVSAIEVHKELNVLKDIIFVNFNLSNAWLRPIPMGFNNTICNLQQINRNPLIITAAQ